MDFATALQNPHEAIKALYAASPSLDGFEQRVESHFKSLIATREARQQIPAITSLSTSADLPVGKLVRFRAMVQDTGLGSEVFRAVGANKEVLGYGIEEEGPEGPGGEDYSNLRERQIFYLVNVPAETAWAKESLDKATAADVQASLDKMALGGSSQGASPLLANKHPIPSEPHFGCLAKIYGDAADKLKTAEVLEFVGIVSESSFSSAFDDLVNDNAASASVPVPALHVLFTTTPDSPAAPLPASSEADIADLRRELLEYLGGAVAGDVDAAEWLLLAILGRIHTRHPTGVALGSLSLNLALPAQTEAPVSSVLSTLLPALASLDLSIPFLNDAKTRLAPRNRDENLESGSLQLPDGTAVVVDTRGIGEGKLEDAGVRNLRHVATTIAQQKLSYQFPYSSFDLDTDLSFIVLSEGKALIPTDCVVYVHPAKDFSSPAAPTPAKLAAFRSFIRTMKHVDFTIPEEMSEVIQADFVDRRQKSVGGEAMTQEDLLFRMGAARLLALSRGEAALSKDAWLQCADLDERRKERAPVPAARKE
ncbi:hypothetical protein MNV49_003303 [Pseudohyphozyma bogoriensis]|nr:hypothetical protein MNV49_003303 [Pseudohyphozyma bogoriensis]